MLLKDKIAVVYGAGAHIGRAVAHAFARDGAKVFLAGRTLSTLEAVAAKIADAGGAAEVAQVDALDPQAIEQHLDAIVNNASRIDIWNYREPDLRLVHGLNQQGCSTSSRSGGALPQLLEIRRCCVNLCIPTTI